MQYGRRVHVDGDSIVLRGNRLWRELDAYWSLGARRRWGGRACYRDDCGKDVWPFVGKGEFQRFIEEAGQRVGIEQLEFGVAWAEWLREKRNNKNRRGTCYGKAMRYDDGCE